MLHLCIISNLIERTLGTCFEWSLRETRSADWCSELRTFWDGFSFQFSHWNNASWMDTRLYFWKCFEWSRRRMWSNDLCSGLRTFLMDPRFYFSDFFPFFRFVDFRLSIIRFFFLMTIGLTRALDDLHKIWSRLCNRNWRLSRQPNIFFKKICILVNPFEIDRALINPDPLYLNKQWLYF